MVVKHTTIIGQLDGEDRSDSIIIKVFDLRVLSDAQPQRTEIAASSAENSRREGCVNILGCLG